MLSVKKHTEKLGFVYEGTVAKFELEIYSKDKGLVLNDYLYVEVELSDYLF
jgi:hypothetical protein